MPPKAKAKSKAAEAATSIVGPDSSLGRFEVGAKLGSGACATVYKVTDTKTNHYTCVSFPLCAKVGPVIPVRQAGGKKRKLTDRERLSATITYENTLYNSVLNKLRGGEHKRTTSVKF